MIKNKQTIADEDTCVDDASGKTPQDPSAGMEEEKKKKKKIVTDEDTCENDAPRKTPKDPSAARMKKNKKTGTDEDTCKSDASGKTPKESSPGIKKLIIDVDTGVDDAQAIMVALSAPNVDVIGITCCHGNTPLDNVVRNTLRVLKVCGRLDIPVFRGCKRPLLGCGKDASNYFGKDGLGDVEDTDPVDLSVVQKQKAAKALINLVNKEGPGEVTLVATAPLTNLAVAVQLDPCLPKKLKALYIMGGNTESRGNTTICGEFNFAADPEAACIVLERYTCPTYIAPWEFSCRNSLPWTFCDTLFSATTDKAEFMEKISRFSREAAQSESYKKKESTEGSGFNSCDTYAVAAAIDDDFILEQEEVAVTVELHGTYTRGMMVLDYMQQLKKKNKAFIMTKVDLKKMKQMLKNSLM